MLNIFKKNKAFTLIELLLAMLIFSIVSVLGTTMLVYGYESFNTYAKSTGQQEKILQSFRVLGKDIQQSSKIYYKISSGNEVEYIDLEIPSSGAAITKRWTITEGAIKCCDLSSTSTAAVSVDGLLSSKSSIELVSSKNTIVVRIMPEPTNKGKYQGNNIREPITTEYSVKYKYLEQIAP